MSAFPGISQRLLEKLRQGLSRWQGEQCRPLVIGTPCRGTNQEAFLSMEILEEAIARQCQVRFQYMEYGVDQLQSQVLLEDQPAEPLPPGVELARYIWERVYPFPGEAVRAVLRCDKDLLDDVLDRFGLETQLRDNGDGTFDAVVFTAPAGLKFRALQY
ncbi:MAG: hypothetical protein K2K53_08280, partial [Oscillospiraceae bacterium]|nr:hypothetical protein [Oscillospiraceae bacterium]